MRKVLSLEKIAQQFSVFHLVVFILTLVTLFSLPNYPGNKFIYILFSFFFNALLLKGFNQNAFYSESFIAVFMWLGFWFKLSGHLIMNNLDFSEAVGNFNKSGQGFDEVLIVSSFGALAFLSSFFACDKIFKKRPTDYQNNSHSPPDSYSKHRILLYIIFLFIVCGVCVANLHYGIYQKGTIPKTHPPAAIKAAITWLLLTGFSCFAATIIYWDIKSKKNPMISIFVSMFESLFSTLSLLSRGFILNTIPQIWSTFRTSTTGQKLSTIQKIIICISFISIFGASVAIVNTLRLKLFFNVDIKDTTAVSSGLQSSTGALIFDRWVGLEGVMSVVSFKSLGWDLVTEVFNERAQGTGTSVYDSKIGKTRYSEDQKTKQNFVTLPGIVAFCYYPGSLWILFLSLFTLSIVAVLGEVAVLSSTSNVILAALFGESIAYRYAHFGHFVHQAHLYFVAFAGTVILIALFQRWYLRSKNEN